MKVLTVCGMGMGTSLMLLMEIQSLAKNNGIYVNGEAVDLGSAKSIPCDLIVASEEIAHELENMPVEVIGIKNLIDKQEIADKVLPAIKKLSH